MRTTTSRKSQMYVTLAEIEKANPCSSGYAPFLDAFKSLPVSQEVFQRRPPGKSMFGPNDHIPLSDVLKKEHGRGWISWLFSHIDRLSNLERSISKPIEDQIEALQKQLDGDLLRSAIRASGRK